MLPLKPFDNLGSPIYFSDFSDLETLIEILVSVFQELSRSEIIRRWKAGALKMNDVKEPFNLNRHILLKDLNGIITVKGELNGRIALKFQLGKEVSVIILNRLTKK